MKSFLIIILLLLFCHYLSGQNESFLIDDWMEMIAEEGIEVDWDENLDFFIKVSISPLNINAVKKEELEKFFFLSDIQIENLLYYLYENGSMLTIYELQGVEGFDDRIIDLMKPFFVVEPLKEIGRYNAGLNVISRFNSIVQTPRGYIKDDANDPVFAGNKQRFLLRSDLEFGNIKLGIAMEKDPGEVYVNNKTQLPDFLVGYAQYTNDSKIQKLVIGSYRLHSGQGMALSNGYSRSYLADPSNIMDRSKPVRGYNGTNELNYLNGIGVEINLWRNFVLTPFFSYKKIDASYLDSISVQLQLTGFHRTESEIDNRKRVGELMFGSIIKSCIKQVNIEGGFYHYRLNNSLLTSKKMYQYFSYSGESLINTWLTYSTIVGNVIMFGELALNDFSNKSLLQGFMWEPRSSFKFSAQMRYFDHGFYAPYQCVRSASVNNSGEERVVFGLYMKPFEKTALSLYHSIIRYNWLKYLVDKLSVSSETMVSVDRDLSSRSTIQIRYRLKQFMKNNSSEFLKLGVQSINQHQYRFQSNYNISNCWNVVTRVEHSIYSPEISDNSYGWLFYQDIVFTSKTKCLKTTFRYSHFDTDDYNSRIYAYEPDVLYAFSVPAFSGNGSRILLNISYRFSRIFTGYFRISNWHYNNRSSIGTGINEISGNDKTELAFQIRLSF
ncbi:MAG: helix-hairpin-helix domain-containing protein [Marinilabiliaceae bacterium]|nr:helix-hairpin-helix domain-containing protein [Marinilabiliaceae bacterium]